MYRFTEDNSDSMIFDEIILDDLDDELDGLPNPSPSLSHQNGDSSVGGYKMSPSSSTLLETYP